MWFSYHPTVAFREGQLFAGYRIARLLGSGGMGDVYLAEHPRLPRQDALKVLPAEISADSDYRARFVREADLASKLWHPHIVSVHDRGECDGQLWISMDFVDGVDAGRHLATRYPGGLPTAEVVAIVSAVAGALDYAHKQGLLHRDVKPSNIMVTDPDHDEHEQRIMLMDFGIARTIDDVSGLTATNMTVGTVAYAAPEQLMGEELDGRADQYALAATAYHLFTGRPLFPHSNPAVVISRHLNAPPPSLASSRRELAPLDSVLAQALNKEPGGRFPRCIDFARALAQRAATMSGGANATTVQAQVSPRVSHGPTRRRATITAIAAAVTVLTAVIAVLWRPWQSDESPGQLPTASTKAAASSAQRPPPPAVPPTAPASSQAVAGKTVFLDAGLNGANGASPNPQVPNGRGGTTLCNPPGAADSFGYPAHALNWDVTNIVAENLSNLGVNTYLSRGDDASAGPCLDERAARANALHPDAIISVQAYGGPASEEGFDVNYSSPPLNEAQQGPAMQLASAVRNALVAAGLTSAAKNQSDGLRGRADLAMLNLAQYPAVLIELGNMNNATDAAQMSSADGRARYAASLTQGIIAYLQATAG